VLLFQNGKRQGHVFVIDCFITFFFSISEIRK